MTWGPTAWAPSLALGKVGRPACTPSRLPASSTLGKPDPLVA